MVKLCQKCKALTEIYLVLSLRWILAAVKTTSADSCHTLLRSKPTSGKNLTTSKERFYNKNGASSRRADCSWLSSPGWSGAIVVNEVPHVRCHLQLLLVDTGSTLWAWSNFYQNLVAIVNKRFDTIRNWLTAIDWLRKLASQPSPACQLIVIDAPFQYRKCTWSWDKLYLGVDVYLWLIW